MKILTPPPNRGKSTSSTVRCWCFLIFGSSAPILFAIRQLDHANAESRLVLLL